MKDLQKHLKKLRTDAAECKLINDLATGLEKRELFARLADHLSVLASEVEHAISAKVSSTETKQRRSHDAQGSALGSRQRHLCEIDEAGKLTHDFASVVAGIVD
ncbi:hypothetical protein [Bradyrhizobium retamae]|uniref:Uncharacterized protein n=1 Tax=Bradyrhizobium retamae TaxID=1300035 RepID=A0A0R3MFI8_9BRAD|nr:hypothetical protein [Bradyrhizobium retamae]KRR18318.1 hypothetical protein CQ13_35265 [Bradyrhizobium retamae]